MKLPSSDWATFAALFLQLVHWAISKHERKMHKNRMEEIRLDPRGAMRRKFSRVRHNIPEHSANVSDASSGRNERDGNGNLPD